MRITCFAALPRVFCFLVLLQEANCRPLEVSLFFFTFLLLYECREHGVDMTVYSPALRHSKVTKVNCLCRRTFAYVAPFVYDSCVHRRRKKVTVIIISKMCTVWGVTIWESYGVCTLFKRKHHIQQISCSPKSIMKTFFGLKSLFKESMWTILFNLRDTLQIAKVTVIQQC